MGQSCREQNQHSDGVVTADPAFINSFLVNRIDKTALLQPIDNGEIDELLRFHVDLAERATVDHLLNPFHGWLRRTQ